MARARNLKPGFFRNEVLGELGVEAAYFFEGLWCQADRDGVVENRPMRLKVEICPYWDWDVATIIESLEKTGLIRCYSSNGKNCIHIVNFAKHQNPHQKEPVSELPRPDYAVSDCSKTSPEKTGLAPDKTESGPAESLFLDPLLPLTDSPIPIGDKSPAKKKPGSRRCPSSWHPTDELINGLWQQPQFQHLSKQEFLDEAEAMKDYEYRDTKVDWDACFRTWMRNHVKRNPKTKFATAEQRRVQNIKQAMQEFANE
jgi:hypothetical protein